MEEFMVPCMSKSVFGMECLGCGTQRAFLLLCKGEFVMAFKMFPAIYTTILLFSFIGLHFLDKARNYHPLIIGFAILNSAIMIISYIYKMTAIN